jgi:hypothetical protein
MVRRGTWASHLCVLAGYVVVAVAFSWPLPLNLGTHLTGDPGGDTGVYVWNQWVFRHELLEHGRLPYFTESIFSLTRSANLSLHNYTTFQDLLAVPLIPLLGVVATFNVVYLLMTVLTAYCTFLLARHVTGRTAEAWLAGLLFAWSPLLVTRGMGHFSLVAAAPLAIFLLVLLKADGHERFRDAVALGAVMWLAASTDVYYAVYCLLIGMVFLVARVLAIHRSPHSGRGKAVRWTLDVLVLCAAGLVGALAISGGGQFSVLGVPLSMRGLHTPVLVLTTLAVLRIAWAFRASLAPHARVDGWRVMRFATAAGLVATVLLSPVLYAFGVRIYTVGLESARVYWRSSPPGVDLLSLVLPNPNHPLAPAALTDWFASRPNGYLENVASIPLVFVVILVYAWCIGWRPSRWWIGMAAMFGALALGPFVHIAGVNTLVPGPWALLRYIPIIGLARAPTRFSVVMMLAGAVIFATALDWIGRRHPRFRPVALGVAGALLIVELLPAPLTLYGATVPRFYDQVAAAPADARVLELPTGVRDGTYSVGNFTPRTQFFQTAHNKPLIGGYLSRVSKTRISQVRDNDIVDALFTLSEGGELPDGVTGALIDQGPVFIKDAKIAYVVIDSTRTPARLRDFARRAFRLERIDGEGHLELYRPAPPLGPPLPVR